MVCAWPAQRHQGIHKSAGRSTGCAAATCKFAQPAPAGRWSGSAVPPYLRRLSHHPLKQVQNRNNGRSRRSASRRQDVLARKADERIVRSVATTNRHTPACKIRFSAAGCQQRWPPLTVREACAEQSGSNQAHNSKLRRHHGCDSQGNRSEMQR